MVASNSNSLLPPIYKFSAVWGNHEGSLLLWALILCVWTAAVAVFSGQLPLLVLSRVLAVMGAIGVGFISFMLFTSNPFERLLPGTPADGNDLNPLLQDPGLIIHPPLLYMGYVGFSVAFAFAKFTEYHGLALGITVLVFALVFRRGLTDFVAQLRGAARAKP